MKYALQKDRGRRQRFLFREARSLQLRALLRSQLVGPGRRHRLYPSWAGRLGALPGRIRNRCVLTGRSGSPVVRFGLSRQTLRSLASGGYVPGLARSSWLCQPPLWRNWQTQLGVGPCERHPRTPLRRRMAGRDPTVGRLPPSRGGAPPPQPLLISDTRAARQPNPV